MDNKDKINITSLPDELLIAILDWVDDKSDIFSLRLAQRRLGAAASYTLQRRSRVIYLEPALSSVERFRHICDCPILAGGVNAIVYTVPQHELSVNDIEVRLTAAQLEKGPRICEEALGHYAQYRAEETGLVFRDELHDLLMHGIESFPQLSKISWTTQPFDDGCLDAGGEGTQNALNCDHRWRRSGQTPSALSAAEELLNAMLWDMQDSAAYDFGILFDALRRHAQLQPNQPLQVELRSCPFTHFGYCIKEFAESQDFRKDLDLALSHISGLYLSTLEPKDEWDSESILTLGPALASGWSTFFHGAKNLDKLALSGEDALSMVRVLSILLGDSTMTFSKLQRLELHSFPLQTRPEAPPSMALLLQGSHTTQQLLDFLLRHKSTLKSLSLRSVSGVDERSGVPSAPALRGLLAAIKAECLRLEEVAVHEISLFIDDWSSGQYEPHTGQWELDYEQTTDMAQLARELDAQAWVSIPCIVRLEDGEPLDQQDHLCFNYQFGEKVLRPELGDCGRQNCRDGGC